MHPGESPAATLAARMAAGQASAFREFYNREAPGLIRYATGLVGCREEARDLAQESFFRLWKNREQLEPSTEPARLLYTILRNLARDRLRHQAVEQRPHPHLELTDVVPAGPLVAEDGEDPDEVQVLVQQALESLSPRQREIILLRWRRHLTYEQIGIELGIAPSTVSAHMQR